MLERLWRTDDDSAVAASALAVRAEPIASAEGDEELALPGVGEGVEELLVLFASAKLGEAGANALGGSSGRFSLAIDGGARVECLDLAQLLQQRSLERQHRAAKPSMPALTRQPPPSGTAVYAATGGARSMRDAAYVSGSSAARLFSPARIFASVSRR